MSETSYKKLWKDFWLPLVSVNGKVSLDCIKRELSDYSFLLDQVPIVYQHVTGGKLSKPHYDSAVIISEHDSTCHEYCEEYALEELDLLVPTTLEAIEMSRAELHKVLSEIKEYISERVTRHEKETK